jgi:hypothetical protein
MVKNDMSGLGGLRLSGRFNYQVVSQFTDVAFVVYPAEIKFSGTGGAQIKLKQGVGCRACGGLHPKHFPVMQDALQMSDHIAFDQYTFEVAQKTAIHLVLDQQTQLDHIAFDNAVGNS